MSVQDYSKLRDPQLRHAAAGGDARAAAELARRGAAARPPIGADVAGLSYRELRDAVLAWRPDADPSTQARAYDAHLELECRWRVVQKLGAWSRYPHDQPPPVPPWGIPRPPRGGRWRRPEGSTLYPSERDLARAALNAAAVKYYEMAAGAPPKEE